MVMTKKNNNNNKINTCIQETMMQGKTNDYKGY
jgi:hypothetical protein